LLQHPTIDRQVHRMDGETFLFAPALARVERL
jgi:hypothetical protein